MRSGLQPSARTAGCYALLVTMARLVSSRWSRGDSCRAWSTEARSGLQHSDQMAMARLLCIACDDGKARILEVESGTVAVSAAPHQLLQYPGKGHSLAVSAAPDQQLQYPAKGYDSNDNYVN